MVLRSGSLRQSLAASTRFLKERIKRASTALGADIPDIADACQDAIDDLLEIQELIQSSINNIEKKDSEWQILIQNLEDEDVAQAEQAQYNTTAVSDPNGYLTVVNDAQTTLSCVATQLRKLNRTLSRLTNPQPISGGGGEGSGFQRDTSSNNFISRVKTPKIVLPTFEGDILKWKEFWSIYKTTIHDRTDFSGVEKFSYLLPQLKGRAKQSIEGLLITDENYDAAIDILTQRFDRSDDRIVSMLYGELKQLPRCGTRSEDKRRTFDTCERIFRQLSLADEDIDSSRALTIDLLSKFPSAMVRDLQRHYKVGVHSKLSEVRTGIKESISELEDTSGIIDDLDAIGGSSASKQKPQQNSNGKKPNSSTNGSQNGSSWTEYREGQNSTFSAVSDGAGASNRPSPHTKPMSSCYFCGGNHFNGDCSKYTTAKSREQRLFELKRCIKCGRNHNAGGKRNQCNNTQVKCVHCKSRNEHYSALCRIRYPTKSDHEKANSGQQKPSQPSKSSDGTGSTCVAVEQTGNMTILNDSGVRNSLFQTAKIQAINLETGNKISVRMCLDTLSNRSYITDKAADLLQLPSHKFDRLLVSVFGSQKSVEVPTRLVEFGILQADGSTQKIEANTTKIISNSGVLPGSWPEKERALLDSMRRSRTLADDPFDPVKSIDVLIGADYAWEFITGSKISSSTGIHFIPSTVGLMLAGRLEYEDDAGDCDRTSAMICITETSVQRSHRLGLSLSASACETKLQPRCPDIDEYWNLETIGITDCPLEKDDDKALETFQKTVFYEDGRYHVTWPWIEEKRCLLPSNYDVSLRRFKSLSVRLKLHEDLLQGYRDVIKVQLDRGIIEKVPNDQIETTNTVHYLPHHPVLKSSSATTKIRIVYDASSKLRKHDVSLNECLLRGPVILPDLCQLLIRFRVHQFVVVSDIEKAFLQVSLQTPERHVTRFLWYDDDNTPDVVSNNLAVYRFCRVAFGVISSPFLLGATIQHHLASENTPFASSLMRDIYVDNVISGVDDAGKLTDYYEQAKSTFNNAGMNLQEFCSNSLELMDFIAECDRVKNTDVKVLGMKWDSTRDDTIRITSSLKWNSERDKPTKRSVLQAVASVYDPLGLFQPVLFRAKLFLQKLWILELSWDAHMDSELKDEWNSIIESIRGIFEFRIPRYIGNLTDTSTIIVFSDASAKGYGVAVYVRCSKRENGWVSNLLYAKSRLAPMPNRTKVQKTVSSRISLPRLELLGATIAATVADFCRDAFGMRQLKVHFFIDSECVLQWIRSKQVLKRFVARRVDKIRCVENCEFHYVNTADNPADYLTRGKTAIELINERKWWHGPTWLSCSETDWPETRLKSTSDEVLREIAAEVKVIDVCHTLATPNAQPKVDIDLANGLLGIDPNDFSSFPRLIRITSICLKFLRKRIWNRLSEESKEASKLRDNFKCVTDDISIESRDVEFATTLWVRHVQSSKFEDIFTAIRENRKHAIVSQLGLKIDDTGVIRTYSRFAHADLSFEAKHPVLLPKDDRLSFLVVTDVHEKLRHSGVSHTLSELRRRFWIPHGRAFVKKVLKRCIVCRLYKTGVPFARPVMPPWPLERVKRSVPFQFTGLDYFGPIKVKVNDTIQKMWACLFTCLATRAVHIEAVSDCTSVNFLNSLIRFISRRGCPQQIISDNAAQFHLMKILLDLAWKRTPTDETLLSYSAQSGIQWKFILELAPWQGGHYERLVGVVKSVLKTAIGRRLLSWTDLVTLLTETESIVNSRPITYIGDDVDSQMRTLRPVDFLISQPANVAANSDDFTTRHLGDSGKQLAAVWKQRKRHLDKLWKQWYDEYLLSLRERSDASHRTGRGHLTRSPREGEVVLIHDKDLPRGSWRLAKVISLISSADGQIRGAEIKLSNGVQLRRAVNFLIPLEVEQEYDEANGDVLVEKRARLNNDSEKDQNDNDDEDFFGFSPEEVQRTIDAIQRVHNFEDVIDRQGVASTIAMVSQSHQ